MRDDSDNTYTVDEERRLTANLAALVTAARDKDFASQPISIDLVCRLHRQLFDGVRDHAGRYRQRGWGTDYLEFGPNRSVFRDLVPEKLEEWARLAERALSSAEKTPDAQNYDEGAFHLAVWVHAKFIQIHPFQDGNGRTSRLLKNMALVRLGLRPIAPEIPKEEYFAALNVFMMSGDLQPVVDLLARTAHQALASARDKSCPT